MKKTCEELVLAGLEKEAKICIIQHFEPSTLKQIFSLWDTKQLEKNYEMYSRDITHWLENYTHLSLNDAAVKALLLGRETIALLMNDPLLPAPFVNESARNQFAQDVQQLDAIGQKLWKKIYEQELNL